MLPRFLFALILGVVPLSHALAQSADPSLQEGDAGGESEVIAEEQVAPEATAHEVADDGTGAERDGDARLLFELATRHYNRGEFDQAADAYRRSYEASARPQLLYNMYLAYRDGGRSAEAASALRRYLSEVDDEDIEADRELLEGRLAVLEEAAAREADEQVDHEEGVTPEHQEPPPVETRGVAIGGVVLASVGGAALVVGIVTGVMASGVESDLESACTNMVCPSEFAGDIERGQRLARTTDAILFGGAALAVGGVLWMLIGRSDGDSNVSASCDGVGCMLQARGEF